MAVWPSPAGLAPAGALSFGASFIVTELMPLQPPPYIWLMVLGWPVEQSVSGSGQPSYAIASLLEGCRSRTPPLNAAFAFPFNAAGRAGVAFFVFVADKKPARTGDRPRRQDRRGAGRTRGPAGCQGNR